MQGQKFAFSNLDAGTYEGVILDNIIAKDKDNFLRTAYVVEATKWIHVEKEAGTNVAGVILSPVWPESIQHKVPVSIDAEALASKIMAGRSDVRAYKTSGIEYGGGPGSPYWSEVRAHNRFIYFAAVLTVAALFLGFMLGVRYGK